MAFSFGDLRIKLFADGADPVKMHVQHRDLPFIRGFTTNPTLMRQAGIVNYEAWARNLLNDIPDKPISFEVLSDDFDEMERQARKIASWGENVYVKIPIVNTQGNCSDVLIQALSASGVKVNVTAVTTLQQIANTSLALSRGVPSIISVFAGRIADTGCDPAHTILEALFHKMIPDSTELLWASTREVMNIVDADLLGCDIITVPDSILAKLPLLGKDLDEMSLDTVKQFYEDVKAAGYSL